MGSSIIVLFSNFILENEQLWLRLGTERNYRIRYRSPNPHNIPKSLLDDALVPKPSRAESSQKEEHLLKTDVLLRIQKPAGFHYSI